MPAIQTKTRLHLLRGRATACVAKLSPWESREVYLKYPSGATGAGRFA